MLLKALYFKGIASIRKMLATQKDLCCLIQPTSILSRDPSINNWLTSFFTNSDSSIVDCRPIENSNQGCNQRGSELNSLVRQREKGDLAAQIERLTHANNRSLPDHINQAVKTAVNHCDVHPIKNIVFGGYRGQQKFAPAPKANHQKFVPMPQAAKSSTFTAERGNQGPLTTPLKIKFFAVFSQKISLEVSPFLSGGGVSKHQ
ncbi:hypothetical protein D0A34_22445 [Microcoleus vaginatus PCC 9802]|nr:hypothetical protein D0A34_22445 [Microcoleus vaginatus PCC 9802]